MTPQEESDQMPEEGPSGQVSEDTSGGSTRSEAKDSAGTPGEGGQEKGDDSGSEGQASGNPANAG